MIQSRKQISRLEHDLRQARRDTRMLRFLYVSLSTVVVGTVMALALTGGDLDSRALVGALAYVAVSLVGIMVIRLRYGLWGELGAPPPSPRFLEIELSGLLDRQALLLNGRRVDLSARRYVYQGEMQRSVGEIRRSSSSYRRVNNTLQSVVIVGSLATTTVASLNDGAGAMKWAAVGLSFAVGLAAGFMGYFKYRERAFYLQQTADDIEEQMKAYDVGLAPYDGVDEQDRIALLVKNVEAIRVAQQRREQQLDQPQSAKDDA